MTPALRAACPDAVHVVTAGGRVLAGGRAALHILDTIGFRTTALVFSIPPIVWAVDAAYRVVADHRPFFAEFLFRDEEGKRLA